MNVSQAIELASSLFIPEFLLSDGVAAVEAERERTEEAIRTLRDDWFAQPKGKETFSFDLVRELADRNRRLCDLIETSDEPDAQAVAARRSKANGLNLARALSDHDLIRGVAALQHRTYKKVAHTVGSDINNLAVAYVEAPVKGTVIGIDIETTSHRPDLGYIINIGWELMDLTPDASPREGEAVWCGLPPAWEGRPVPLESIHHITADMIAGKTPLREDHALQKSLVTLLTTHPYMAHNAAFEDSWFLLHLKGYAEARKRGAIIPIDTRDICRRIDKDLVGLPRESHPAALEMWARRRGTLNQEEKERHQGLDDTDLMLKTVQAEFALRNMFSATAATAASTTARTGARTTATASTAAHSSTTPASSTAPAAPPATAPTTASLHTEPLAALPAYSAAQQAAIEDLTAQLASSLATRATQGPEQLTAWIHDWISQAVAQLPRDLRTNVHVGELNEQGFVATLSAQPPSLGKAYDLPARVNVVDQTDLARALATFAAVLATAHATHELPAYSVNFACFR